MSTEIVLYIFVCLVLFLLISGGFILITYGSTILFIKKFHTSANIVLLNVVIWYLLLDIATIAFVILSSFFPFIYSNLCIISAYLWNIPVCGVTYSLMVMSVSQLCRVLYPRRLLFRKKKWILICCGIQWILAILLPIPLITSSPEVRFTSYAFLHIDGVDERKRNPLYSLDDKITIIIVVSYYIW